MRKDAESFEQAANNVTDVTDTFACLSNAITVAALNALANVDVLTTVD